MKLSVRKLNSGKKKWKFLFLLPIMFVCIVGIHCARYSHSDKNVGFNNIDGSEASMDTSVFEKAKLLNIRVL